MSCNRDSVHLAQAEALDAAKISELRDAIGDPVTNSLLLMLRDEICTRMPAIINFAHDDSRADFVREVHALRGACINVGALRLGAVLGGLEFLEGSIGQVPHLITELSAAADATIAEIDEHTRP